MQQSGRPAACPPCRNASRPGFPPRPPGTPFLSLPSPSCHPGRRASAEPGSRRAGSLPGGTGLSGSRLGGRDDSWGAGPPPPVTVDGAQPPSVTPDSAKRRSGVTDGRGPCRGVPAFLGPGSSPGRQIGGTGRQLGGRDGKWEAMRLLGRPGGLRGSGARRRVPRSRCRPGPPPRPARARAVRAGRGQGGAAPAPAPDARARSAWRG